ncbi:MULTISPECIES: CbtA family protein [unclassified Pseudomonas]|uniref:CbtA family protein n=1 Tax=unclassified Pseudomonas TaxID=196821 RepID=UPI000BDC3D48|nr:MULTISPECIES: CbtA family protein [unclassified Pseudomonas]PVZ13791.1 putative cobalt transporter subunit CbtA [Pseudomonas sp. URIL14HWK12:I12]PVZ24097.1 putative cobalt transporter subunit CbtA [Pseudomonas sp. URIL14HWK12:I10]PVZ33264.1 putative cobalt transporter subunit CbtA [Pseudomonas sp. URIL14HWK12:I11]SNZ10923.1 Probable cobalt transporter subunit (CbtA) [Pseudomonas sp. URIL14HWK12:I9]
MLIRKVQAGAGLFTGVMVYSLSMGGLVALMFAYAMGRLRVFGLGPRGLALLLAFVAVHLVPGLKYPANPPAVGDPETIGARTRLFFLMILVSVAAMVLAVSTARALFVRWGGWNASLAAVALYGVTAAVVVALFPAVSEVPERFSAALLWEFRIVALGIHTFFWIGTGCVFGLLARLHFLTVPSHNISLPTS